MLDHRIALHVVPTSRDPDGLARSSRNSYLSPSMRQKAFRSAKIDLRILEKPGSGHLQGAMRCHHS